MLARTSRSDRIYSSGNRGVKKGPGPRGTRNGEFLVSSIVLIAVIAVCIKNRKSWHEEEIGRNLGN